MLLLCTQQVVLVPTHNQAETYTTGSGMPVAATLQWSRCSGRRGNRHVQLFMREDMLNNLLIQQLKTFFEIYWLWSTGFSFCDCMQPLLIITWLKVPHCSWWLGIDIIVVWTYSYSPALHGGYSKVLWKIWADYQNLFLISYWQHNVGAWLLC